MNNLSTERRQDYRQLSMERLFVQIVACNDPELVGTTVSCNTFDVSARGLGIMSEREIPAGSRIDIWVDISSGPGKFFLTCDVRWSQDIDDGYYAGVQLHDGSATDIAEWRVAHT